MTARPHEYECGCGEPAESELPGLRDRRPSARHPEAVNAFGEDHRPRVVPRQRECERCVVGIAEALVLQRRRIGQVEDLPAAHLGDSDERQDSVGVTNELT